jgi:hypothetical protein
MPSAFCLLPSAFCLLPSLIDRYTSLLPVLSFEKNGQCVTADYYNPSVSPLETSFDLVNSQT